MLNAKGLRRLLLSLYQGRPYRVRLDAMEGRFYRPPHRPVKVVAVEHLRGGRGREVFYSTRTDVEAEPILQWFSRRWSIEVTFHECKRHLGIDEPENRTREAVRRTAPTGFLMYSLITLWHECVRPEPATPLRNYRGKSRVSFADMLAALRVDSLHEFQKNHLSPPGIPPAVRKILQPLERLIQLAA